MPIYDYICKNCGSRFDKLMPTLASAQEVCPECPQCGSKQTQRIPSAFAVAGSPAGHGISTESEATPASNSPVTAKEDIDRWRKLGKKKK
jgi:putative FmdB family regulatory protein